jgi:hypothetical protein
LTVELFEARKPRETAVISEIDGTVRHGGIVISLDAAEYDRCVSGGSAVTQVTAEASLAKDPGVSGTPAFLLGLKLRDGSVKATKWPTGSLPFAEFQREIDKILNDGRP